MGGNGGSAHFNLCKPERHDLSLGHRRHGLHPNNNAGANYSGLAINQAQTQLYAANQAGTGSINVFNSSSPR